MAISIIDIPTKGRGQEPKETNKSGLRRSTLYLIVCGVLAITAVSIGLGVGLSKRSKGNTTAPFTGESNTQDGESNGSSSNGKDNGDDVGSSGSGDNGVHVHPDGTNHGDPANEDWSENCEYDPTKQNNYGRNPVGDISYAKLVNRNPDCSAYKGVYQATINDHQEDTVHHSHFEITYDVLTDKCIFESNNIPNHDIGKDTTNGRDFGSTVDANNNTYRLEVPRNPTNPDPNTVPTYITRRGGFITMNGIMLNGVDLDMDSAFCYNENFPGPIKISLRSRDDPTIRCTTRQEWYAIPVANPNIVTVDEYKGHSFNGRYHYHGNNDALYSHDHDSEGDIFLAAKRTGCSGSPVVGFAPDGFPIYGQYYFNIADRAWNLRKAKSSYRIKESFIATGRRDIGGSEPVLPINDDYPLGIFENDWEYVDGYGDLDECNGMVDYYGNYGYYYTDEYPYGPVCTKGVPDPSFTKPSSEYEREDGESSGGGRPNGGGGRPNNSTRY